MEKGTYQQMETSNRQGALLALLGVLFVASNLRAPLTSVGPVIDQISHHLALSNAAVGLVTTLPLLAFGFLSGWIPRISEKFGMEIVLFFSLIILSIGLLIRSVANISSLFLGAALVGSAITVGNVLMPAYIKKMFPLKVGLVMGIYTIGMNLTAALAAGYSISLGRWTKMGWQGAIGIWIILSILAMLIWLPQVKKSKRKVKVDESIADPKVNLFKSKIAWSVTFFMGIQSLLFYVLAAWLPKMAQDWGMSAEASGWALSYIQFAQLPMSFIGAIIATKMKDQRILSILVGTLFSIGLLGILFFKTQYLIICCVLIGIASGLAFSLSMLFFVLRTNYTSHSSKLSGMAQSIGYLVAATGPPLVGFFFDQSQSWTSSFIFLIIASVLLLAFGLIAGKDSKIA